MNKNIIIAILVVVIIAVAAALMLGSNGKMDTQINFLSEDTLNNEEQVQFELKDAEGKAISGQIVNVTFGDEKYSLVTDENGKGYLVISDESAGKYDITVDYGGDDKYNGCSAKQTITVEDGAADNPAPQTNSNSTANSTNGTAGLHYDVQYGVYYDDNGILRNNGGQIDGMSIYDIRARGGIWNGIN